MWLEFSVRCGYLLREDGRRLYTTYEEIIRTVVGMINHPETWLLTQSDKTIHEAEEEYLDFL